MEIIIYIAMLITIDVIFAKLAICEKNKRLSILMYLITFVVGFFSGVYFGP